MKNQLDLIARMTSLMDGIEAGTVSLDQAKAITQAADVVVQVMKTEASIYAGSEGALRPSFLQLEGDAIAAAADRQARIQRLSRV